MFLHVLQGLTVAIPPPKDPVFPGMPPPLPHPAMTPSAGLLQPGGVVVGAPRAVVGGGLRKPGNWTGGVSIGGEVRLRQCRACCLNVSTKTIVIFFVFVCVFALKLGTESDPYAAVFSTNERLCESLCVLHWKTVECALYLCAAAAAAASSPPLPARRRTLVTGLAEYTLSDIIAGCDLRFAMHSYYCRGWGEAGGLLKHFTRVSCSPVALLMR